MQSAALIGLDGGGGLGVVRRYCGQQLMGLVVIFGAQGLGNLMAGVVQLGEAEVLRNTLDRKSVV